MRKRNKGWPKTLQNLVLDAISEGSDCELGELVRVVEEQGRTFLFVGQCLCLGFRYTGPDKDWDYKLIITDGSNRKLLDIFVDLREENARIAAEEGVAELVLRNLLSKSSDLSLAQEFSSRKFEWEDLE